MFFRIWRGGRIKGLLHKKMAEPFFRVTKEAGGNKRVAIRRLVTVLKKKKERVNFVLKHRKRVILSSLLRAHLN